MPEPERPTQYGDMVTLVRQPRRDPRRMLTVITMTVSALTLLGVPLGLIWSALAPAMPVVKTPEGPFPAGNQPEEAIAADGWFSLLGFGFGVVTALAVWLLLRYWRGLPGLVAAVLGGIGAALVAWQLGRRIGLSDYERRFAAAEVGEVLDKPADLQAGGFDRLFDLIPMLSGDVLLPAFAAAVAYTLLAGWSRWPGLRPEPSADYAGPAGFSSSSMALPAPSAVPEPPGPGAATPPPD